MHPCTLAVFIGQMNFFALDFEAETIFRNNECVSSPKMMVCKMCRWYRSRRIQANQMSIFRNAGFFAGFAAGSLFRLLITFTAA